jgi:opacity protein-like surface antigen
MTRFAAALAICIFLTGSFAFAQDDIPKIQVFGGYSLLHEDTAGLTPSTIEFVLRQPARAINVTTLFNGWSAEAQYNADRWFGVAVDVSGQNGAPFTASSGSGITDLPKGSRYSFLGGPVLTYRTKSKLTPFAHALFGWERDSLSATTVGGTSPPFAVNASTYTDFTMALGGGADYKLSHRFSLRLGQLEWFHTSLNFNKFYGSAFDSDQFQGFRTRQRNLRFSSGVVVRF